MESFKGTALVLGAGGFIGSHMVKRLKKEGYWVRGVDIKRPEFCPTHAHEFVQGDLRHLDFVRRVLEFKGYSCNFYNEVPRKYIQGFDLIFQYSADMGGAGFVFTGDHDAEILYNSMTIDLNVLESLRQLNETLGTNRTKIFYSSSACVYPEHNQLDPDSPDCREDSAWPAAPDSSYGVQKLFSEHVYLAYHKNHAIPVRIGRFHNIMGVEGTWQGGREKAPAAICRKIAALPQEGGVIEIWGDGKQTRSFLYVDECVEATWRLMQHPDFMGPVNIGSEEMVSINELVDMTAKIAGKRVEKKYLEGPVGVRGRNSHNALIRDKLGWDNSMTLEQSMERLYPWVLAQLHG